MGGDQQDSGILAGHILFALYLALVLLTVSITAWGQSMEPGQLGDDPSEDGTDKPTEFAEADQTDTSTNEDPEAARRAKRPLESPDAFGKLEYNFYGSVRLHAIKAFDTDSGESEQSLGDGASRVGVSAEWQLKGKWNLFGRLESGFDVLETFTTTGQSDTDSLLTPRLYYFGIESDALYLKLGKSWSAYYQVAGAADRFSIFGGNATGIYNAGTDGGATGTGRADNAVQTRTYINLGNSSILKPFNLNLQYQHGEPIPKVKGATYGSTYSLSAWLETEREFGIGLAWHEAKIDEVERPELSKAGISGDARALAVAFKTYGQDWLASLVFSRLENIETTDQFLYFDGTGAELFAQWQFRDRWWLAGGGNYLDPDSDDPDAGQYQIRYLVLGVRYTFDSFNRMLYAEWRDDYGKLADGTRRGNEVTVGFRWDFGY